MKTTSNEYLTTMESSEIKKSSVTKERMSDWFDGLLNHVNTERLMMETGVAPEESKKFWNAAISEDHESMSKNIRAETTQYFIKNLVQYYFGQLSSYEVRPQKLAFDFSDAKILVWAQIGDEDQSTENALILSEAQANNKFSENGFFVSTTIVEESDRLAIPPHYHEVRINGGLSGTH